MAHHALDPEATGTVAAGATWARDDAGTRRQVDPLRCEFAGWLGDDLVGVHPDFVVSGALADALRASDLTGFELRAATVTTSAEFVSYAGTFPDRWERLVPTGGAGDFGARGGLLLVSDRALALLNTHRIAEASLTAGAETAQTARFVRQQQQARTAAQARANAEREAALGAAAGEAVRITTLRDAAGPGAVAPTMRTQAKREIAGDLTLAAKALGAGPEGEATLAVLRLIDGPVEVDRPDAAWTTYRSPDRSVQVHVSRDVVTGVEFVLAPHRNAPDARYPRTSHLIEGVDAFTREAALDRLGEPVGTRGTTGYTYDEYRLGRKRLLLYWDAADQSPRIVIVGRKG